MPPDQRSDTGTTISTTRKSREMLYRSDYDRSMIQTTGVASGYILDGLTRPRVGPPSGFTFCLPLTLVALRAPSVSGKQKAKPDRSRAIKTGHLDLLATPTYLILDRTQRLWHIASLAVRQADSPWPCECSCWASSALLASQPAERNGHFGGAMKTEKQYPRGRVCLCRKA